MKTKPFPFWTWNKKTRALSLAPATTSATPGAYRTIDGPERPKKRLVIYGRKLVRRMQTLAEKRAKPSTR